MSRHVLVAWKKRTSNGALVNMRPRVAAFFCFCGCLCGRQVKQLRFKQQLLSSVYGVLGRLMVQPAIPTPDLLALMHTYAQHSASSSSLTRQESEKACLPCLPRLRYASPPPLTLSPPPADGWPLLPPLHPSLLPLIHLFYLSTRPSTQISPPPPPLPSSRPSTTNRMPPSPCLVPRSAPPFLPSRSTASQRPPRSPRC